MKYSFLLLICSLVVFNACENGETAATNYLIDTWHVNNQTIHFVDDSSALVISKLQEEKMDAMFVKYNFQPDSTPVQLDMNVYEGKLKGMHLFGIIEMKGRDSFLMASKMGFEGQAYKYRPKSLDSMKVVTYVRE